MHFKKENSFLHPQGEQTLSAFCYGSTTQVRCPASDLRNQVVLKDVSKLLTASESRKEKAKGQ